MEPLKTISKEHRVRLTDEELAKIVQALEILEKKEEKKGNSAKTRKLKKRLADPRRGRPLEYYWH